MGLQHQPASSTASTSQYTTLLFALHPSGGTQNSRQLLPKDCLARLAVMRYGLIHKHIHVGDPVSKLVCRFDDLNGSKYSESSKSSKDSKDPNMRSFDSYRERPSRELS